MSVKNDCLLQEACVSNTNGPAKYIYITLVLGLVEGGLAQNDCNVSFYLSPLRGERNDFL